MATKLPPNPTFKFSVDEAGKFTYGPPDKWKYVHTDKVRFECNMGPFSVTLVRADVNNGSAGLANPFGAIHGQQAPDGTWFAVAKINDGLTDEERRTEFLAKGFVAQYKYLMEVHHGSKVFKDFTKHGIHMC